MFSSLSRKYILGRVALYGAAILLALWTLAPLYLVALAAFSTRQATFQWPKPLLPTDFSTDTMQFFVNSKGVLDSVWNSIVVALLTIAGSLLLGAPGGYALARFRFRGKEAISLGLSPAWKRSLITSVRTLAGTTIGRTKPMRGSIATV